MAIERMSDYEYWLKNQFLAKKSNQNWLGEISNLKKLASEGNFEANKNYQVIYRPHKCPDTRYFAFSEITYVENDRNGIFTFDSDLSLEAVEIVKLYVTEKFNMEDYIKGINGIK